MSQRQFSHGHLVKRGAPAAPFGIRVRRALFGISPREAALDRRGFADARPAARARLEAIGVTFIEGYNALLANELPAAVSRIPRDLQGFAVEGAAMASALLDHLSPWPWPWRGGRLAQLLRDRPEHVYMIHIGAGWATARLKRSLERAVRHRDPLLGWLAADGWGFHQTYFHPAQWASGRKRFAAHGYLTRAVDQGIGRALWFVAGADPARVAGTIERFAAERHADLWSGVGLAATYAGGCAPDELKALRVVAGDFRAQLAQGTAFAATARTVADNVTEHTELAARTLAGRDPGELHRLAMQHQPVAPHEILGDSYERWRTGLSEALTKRGTS
jgi:enediyne biosynthesis protein E3